MSGDPKENELTLGLIRRLFTDSADEDYLVARLSFKLNLQNQFVWSAQQAIEKYFKAAILMNGKSVKKFKHNLVELYGEVKANNLYINLIPDTITPPIGPGVLDGVGSIVTENTSSVVERFCENGLPSQRYRDRGLLVFEWDLHYFDELCFLVRRCNVNLMRKFPKDGGDGSVTMSDILQQKKRWQPSGPLKTLNARRSFDNHEETSPERWRNFSYFPEQAIHGGFLANQMLHEYSPLWSALNLGPKSLAAFEWILKNTIIDKDLRIALSAAIASRSKL